MLRGKRKKEKETGIVGGNAGIFWKKSFEKVLLSYGAGGVRAVSPSPIDLKSKNMLVGRLREARPHCPPSLKPTCTERVEGREIALHTKRAAHVVPEPAGILLLEHLVSLMTVDTSRASGALEREARLCVLHNVTTSSGGTTRFVFQFAHRLTCFVIGGPATINDNLTSTARGKRAVVDKTHKVNHPTCDQRKPLQLNVSASCGECGDWQRHNLWKRAEKGNRITNRIIFNRKAVSIYTARVCLALCRYRLRRSGKKVMKEMCCYVM